jgi:1-acyl-sn-glycerol-3-phosphate acyltransferase
VSFLAKSTLLKMPVIGALARALDTLPVYRQQDAGENTSRNSETFALARRLLARGGGIAIFPEGVSHNEPRLLRLKTGAARIALGAAARREQGADGVRACGQDRSRRVVLHGEGHVS